MAAMRGILAFALFMMADARPEGYGVKGGRSYQSTATAVASAHADAGSPARASSSAIATADSQGYAGSNAVARADASADARGAGYDVRHKENRNANNGLVDYGDLRHSNDRTRITEYKCPDHGDETASWNQQIPVTEHVTSEFEGGEVERANQLGGHVDCSKNAAGSGCKDKTSGVADGSVAEGQSPQTIDGTHSSNSCAPGDFTCSTGPDSPSESSKPGVKDGYGGSDDRPGMIDRSHAASPCAPGNPKCYGSKPIGPNFHPTFPKHSDSSAVSSSTGGEDRVASNEKPKEVNEDHHESACASGDSKCATNSHSHSGEKSDQTTESLHFTGESSNLGPGKPEATGNPTCAPGTPCSSHKPSVVSPYPGQTQDSQHSTGFDSGYEDSKKKPETPSWNTCAPGDSKCFAAKPSVSNPYPIYTENPDSSAGSSSPKVIDGGYGGKEKPGVTGHSDHGGITPCAPWDSKCSSQKPTISNLPVSWDESLSYDSQHSTEITGGFEEQTSVGDTYAGSHLGSPCTTGDSKCTHKPSRASYPMNNANPWSPSSGHSHPDKVTNHPSSGSKLGTSNPFLNGQIDLSHNNIPSKPAEPSRPNVNPSNPFLHPHNHPSNQHPSIQHPPVPAPPQYPQGSSSGSGFPQVAPKPQNPFLSHPGFPKPTSGVKHPQIESTHRQDEKDYTIVNGSPNVDCHRSGSCEPNKPSTNFPVPPKYPHGASPPSSPYPEIKPNPSNPFLSHHATGDKSSRSIELQVGNNHHPHTGSQPESITPGKDCDKSLSNSVNKPTEQQLDVPSKNPYLTNLRPKVESHPIPGHDSIQFSDQKSDNGLLTSKPGSLEIDGKKPGTIQGCGSSSVICNQVPNQMGHHSSTNGLQGSSTTGQNNVGVKGHRPGVKGGHREPGLSIGLQGSPQMDVRSDWNPSAESNANASAYSTAHASSSSAAAHSHASAKSEAHSNSDGYVSSNSWSSSNASASAFASSYSNSYGWTGPVLPEVPAQ